jgi:cobalt-precorrin 5A hydrolase
MKLAIYAITVNGVKQARRLLKGLPFADVFVKQDLLEQDAPQIAPLTSSLGDFVAARFSHYDGHIFICAAGIVTRVISNLIADKRTDPAVLCIDEQANFVIPVLSGHRGGANALAERSAYLLRATAVITTASDVSGTLAVDMLGAPFGWVLDERTEAAITRVSAAVVNHKPVAIVQQAGDLRWWQSDKRMPSNLICHTNLDELKVEHFSGAILISDEATPPINGWQGKLVLWRPKSLVLGIGCDRNTPRAVLEAGLEQFSQLFNVSLSSVAVMASIDLKADEPGLLELSQQRQWPFVTYPAEQLDNKAGIEHPSDYVKKVTGSNSVAEAAALTSAQTDQLLVGKWVFRQGGFNMTIACCRKQYTEPLVMKRLKNWFNDNENRHGLSALVKQDKNGSPKINACGNEVVPGYQCKPKHADLNRPMLHYSHHILLCEGGRCAKTGVKNLAHDLRNLLKKMGLASGAQRIKISRTLCAGACRNKATAVVYQRMQPGPLLATDHSPESGHVLKTARFLKADTDNAIAINNAIWLRHLHDLSEAQWCELFQALADGVALTEVLDERYFAAIEPPQNIIEQTGFVTGVNTNLNTNKGKSHG